MDDLGVAVGSGIEHPVVVRLLGIVFYFGVPELEAVHYLWLKQYCKDDEYEER